MWLKEHIPHKHVFKEIGLCVLYDKYSRFDNRHNQGDLYDHLTSMRTFTLIALKFMRKVTMASTWICYCHVLSHISHLKRSGLIGKGNHLRPIYLTLYVEVVSTPLGVEIIFIWDYNHSNTLKLGRCGVGACA